MARNVVFLAGAPNADELSWSEGDLNQRLQSPTRRFLSEDDDVDNTTATATQLALSTSSHSTAKWREIPFANDKSATTKTTISAPNEAAAFLNYPPGSQDHDLFLAHSLAQLHSLQQDSSTLFASQFDATTTFISNPSFSTTSFSSSSSALPSSSSPTKRSAITPGPSTAPATIHPASLQITPLSHLPSARHLLSLHPQTPTLNLLVSIITIHPTRTVSLRRQPGQSMEIIELLVGDETRAGFGVSFWLVPVESHARTAGPVGGRDGMREQLEALRRGDVVLLTNVALQEFRGNVFGQSLSRRISKNATAIKVFAVGEEVGGEMGRKIKRVREWARNFVGGGMVEGGGNVKGMSLKRARDESLLPPETQEFEMVRNG